MERPQRTGLKPLPADKSKVLLKYSPGQDVLYEIGTRGVGETVRLSCDIDGQQFTSNADWLSIPRQNGVLSTPELGT